MPGTWGKSPAGRKHYCVDPNLPLVTFQLCEAGTLSDLLSVPPAEPWE